MQRTFALVAATLFIAGLLLAVRDLYSYLKHRHRS
jgi:hypothetical protein